MPDFSMCVSERCPRRADCRRNLASGTRPSHRQSWADFHDKRDGKFWCRANEEAAVQTGGEAFSAGEVGNGPA